MESIKLSDLVQCISKFLMRELHEIAKSQKRPGLIDHCVKARSILKRVKKVISWIRVHYNSLPKEEELDSFISTRQLIYGDISSLLFSLHQQQKYSLRTPPFAVNEAADVLCRGEYHNFPNIGIQDKKNKIMSEKFTRTLKHKTLLLDIPLGVKTQ